MYECVCVYVCVAHTHLQDLRVFACAVLLYREGESYEKEDIVLLAELDYCVEHLIVWLCVFMSSRSYSR